MNAHHGAHALKPTHGRLLLLDVIRGIALCGIAFVNVQSLWSIYPASIPDSTAWTSLELLAHQRFFPAFTFLFGIGFAMIMRSARRRGRDERVIMLRRLLPLLVVGYVHGRFHPGEALGPYALDGLIVLFPLTFLPAPLRRRIAIIGGVILVLPGAYFGGALLIPGLLMLGFAAAEWCVPEKLDANPRPAAWSLVGLVPAAVGLSIAQYADREHAGFSAVSSIAGLVTAASWMALVCVALRTPLRGFLAVCFASLGRMALTNYLAATVFILLAKQLLGLPQEQLGAPDSAFHLAWAVVAFMLVAQGLFSTWWLDRFGQGPCEKAWRWLTWGTLQKHQPAAPPTSASTSTA